MKWVIVDRYSKEVGYAYNSPMEGWIFTKLKNRAERFNTRNEARDAIEKHYKRLAQYLKVEMVTD
jgi:hypothetical protein